MVQTSISPDLAESVDNGNLGGNLGGAVIGAERRTALALGRVNATRHSKMGTREVWAHVPS